MIKSSKNSFLFIMGIMTSLFGATDEMGKREKELISCQNKQHLYGEMIQHMKEILMLDSLTPLQDQKMKEIVKKAEHFNLLEDLLSYQTLENGNTFLHIALIRKHINIALLLIKKSTVVHLMITNKKKEAPIHTAIGLNIIDLITALHEKEPNCLKVKGGALQRLPLHYAVAQNAFLVIETLLRLDSGVINLQDKEGNTPVHLCKTERMFELLSKYGADFTIKNNEGITAQDLLIQSYGALKRAEESSCLIS